MKVLHVIDSGGLYGAEVMLLNLVAEQLKQGLEPVIASIGEPQVTEKPLEAEARSRGMQVERFRMRPGPNVWGALSLVKFAWQGNFDLFHSHGYKANILFGMIPRSIRKIPVVATIHGSTSMGKMNRMRLYEWADSLFLNFIESVVLVNEAMRGRINHRNLHVVNNGIPLIDEIYDDCSGERQPPVDREIVAFCQKGFTIGAIGRLSEEKGFEHLLEAIKMVSVIYPSIRLVILGEGSQRKTLEDKIKKLEIYDSVLLPGYRDWASRYLEYFKVLTLSSLTEGLPIVILEAMQAGVPIVSTRVGGVPEVLANGAAGILVDSSDPAALAEGVVRLLEDSGLRMRLAEHAKKRVSEKYSSKRMADEYTGIYSSMVKLLI